MEPTLPETTVPTPQPVKEAAAKISVKDLLESIGKGSMRILKERPVDLHLPDGETVIEMKVYELTKNQYDKLLVYTTQNLPDVPTIEQKYTQARRNPLNGEIKPAGSYFEPNPNDPSYIAATQRWFNNSAVLFGMFASAQEFGFNLDLEGEELHAHIEEQMGNVNRMFPTPTLLDIAYEAAIVNRGIPVAEQLIGAVEQHRSMARMEALERELEDQEFAIGVETTD